MNDACAASEPFVLQVLGDSMEPEFTDGTVIVVEPGGVLQNGSY
ncbi:MAG TPA: S24 family peptidase, partial [Chromatiales bacterium]|nr:S24 family peptidase [Chromatiales bacterium]